MLAKGKNYHANILSNFFMNFLPEKKYGVPSQNFVKKNVLCEKGDEITRFDGNNDTLFTLNSNANLAIPILFS